MKVVKFFQWQQLRSVDLLHLVERRLHDLLSLLLFLKPRKHYFHQKRNFYDKKVFITLCGLWKFLYNLAGATGGMKSAVRSWVCLALTDETLIPLGLLCFDFSFKLLSFLLNFNFTMNPVDLLSNGLLDQFTSLKDLEKQLSQLLSKQCEMLENDFKELNHYQTDQQLAEISLMVRLVESFLACSFRIHFTRPQFILDEEDEPVSTQAETTSIRHALHSLAMY